MKKKKKNENFDPHQMICFWKSETEPEMDLMEFLRSEVIRGYWRPIKTMDNTHFTILGNVECVVVMTFVL